LANQHVVRVTRDLEIGVAGEQNSGLTKTYMSRIWNNLEDTWRLANNVETEYAKIAVFLLCQLTQRCFTCTRNGAAL